MPRWTPLGMGENRIHTGYTYAPFSYTPPPELPEQKEANRLHKDANYIGTMMLALTAAMNFIVLVAVIILLVVGVLNADRIEEVYLGLDNLGFLLLYGVMYTFAMAGPAILISLCFRRRQFPLKPAKSVPWDVAFFGVLAVMGVCMVANLIANGISAFFQEFGISTSSSMDIMEPTMPSYLLNVLVIAVLPALLEELVFRGYVLQALRPYGDWFAIFVSALLFGLMHENIEQIPFAFVVGLALGWLCVYTNNIWLSVAAHFCNNALSLTLDFLGNQMEESAAETFCMYTMLGVGLLGIISAVILVIRRRWMFLPTPRRSLLPVSRRLGILCKSAPMAISVVVFILMTIWGACL